MVVELSSKVGEHLLVAVAAFIQIETSLVKVKFSSLSPFYKFFPFLSSGGCMQADHAKQMSPPRGCLKQNCNV